MRTLVRVLGAVTLSWLVLSAADDPRIVYTKSFPGSIPAWVEITVSKNGAGQYKEDPKDADPIDFQLSDKESAQIFDLSGKLDHFSHPLEGRGKVANMGLKTLHYEGGGESHEVRFNYSENPDAMALSDWFERIVETERAYIELERAIRFEKLGVQNAILQIEIIRNQKRLMAQRQFLPLLDRVSKNESFLNIARERAAALADSIRKAE